jgi:hypothetical protein
MSRIYRIELRCEFADPSRYEVAEQAMRAGARKLLSQIRLLSDIREPQIALIFEDGFMGTDELAITEPDDGPG